ncbi:ABC transporter substrate-binding protein [Halalkalibacter sp. APA_J-10(15)]|uniref:ABC transporter substrate-binding protein n=1 Tax=Halalkalibacter sp. APA_J-10(15) TaxID=2933805 RepID=UPI001FF10FB1|nr:extracellular solute-binding protein [Halalkalibacter sp. APA_J-10(15)]MCK0473206.1 extracellular solute-binding protein [Halalkalibacter sp. APA_J-10(15)]
MRKRWGLLSSIMVVLLLIVVGCSSGGNNSSSEPAEDNGDGGTDSVEEITLRFVHWINEDSGKWEPLISQYEEQNPGVTIESMPLVENMNSQDYYQQLDLMAAAGEYLDIIMFSNLNDYVARINAGLLEPLTPFLDAEGIDINEEYVNSYAEIDGDYYGVPMKQVTNMILMNKNHLDEAGLEIPEQWTWDEYREFAKQLTTDDRHGSYLHIWHDMHSLLKFPGKPEGANRLLKSDGTSNADDPLVRESLELRYALENEDETSVPLSSILSQQMDYRQQFFTEAVSMLPIGSFMLSEWGQFTPEFEIAWAPWPQNGETDKNYTGVGGDALSIAKSSEHKQEAYDFIRWLTTEGIMEQKIWVPSWRNADLTTAVENIASNTSNPEALHIESIVHTLQSSEPIEIYAPASYITEVHTDFATEVERYLLGNQDIDTAIENVQARVQNIVESNQ